MTPAVVGNWDTTAAISNGLGRVYMVSNPHRGADRFRNSPPMGLTVWGKPDSSNRSCQILGGHFHPKKGPATSWLAATGLVKSWMVIFTEKKRLRQAG